MNAQYQPSNDLERELTPEPIAASAAGSIALHALLLGCALAWGWTMGLFHHNLWGSTGAGAAMQVSLVSTALPLPNDQPVNQNVLTTDKPSTAPATPSPKEKQIVDDKAIDLSGKVKPQDKQQAPKSARNQQPARDNVARYGEQNGTVIPRGMPSAGSNGPAQVGDNSFAAMFGWYVDQINRKMSASWNRFEVDPRTPRGTRANIIFTIHRDGSASDIKLDRSSGSPTLDRSCMRGAQRVDTFGQLPGAYRQNSLSVFYYCEY
jgi:protein TonB